MERLFEKQARWVDDLTPVGAGDNGHLDWSNVPGQDQVTGELETFFDNAYAEAARANLAERRYGYDNGSLEYADRAQLEDSIGSVTQNMNEVVENGPLNAAANLAAEDILWFPDWDNAYRPVDTMNPATGNTTGPFTPSAPLNMDEIEEQAIYGIANETQNNDGDTGMWGTGLRTTEQLENATAPTVEDLQAAHNIAMDEQAISGISNENQNDAGDIGMWDTSLWTTEQLENATAPTAEDLQAAHAIAMGDNTGFPYGGFDSYPEGINDNSTADPTPFVPFPTEMEASNANQNYALSNGMQEATWTQSATNLTPAPLDAAGDFPNWNYMWFPAQENHTVASDSHDASGFVLHNSSNTSAALITGGNNVTVDNGVPAELADVHLTIKGSGPSKKRKRAAKKETVDTANSDGEWEEDNEPRPKKKRVTAGNGPQKTGGDNGPAGKNPGGPPRSYDQLKAAPGPKVVDPGVPLTVEEVLAFLPQAMLNANSAMWVITSSNQWGPNSITAYLGRTRNATPKIRSTISYRLKKAITTATNGAFINFKDWDAARAVQGQVQGQSYSLDFFPQGDNPLLRDLGANVVMPTGAAAGTFTQLVQRAMMNPAADCRLGDCQRMVLDPTLFI